MQQEVYLDIYILINTSMDLLCLMLTATLLHKRARRWRLVLGGLLGGLYAAAALLLGASGIIGFLGDILIAVAMCLLTFGVKGCTLWGVLRPVPVLLLVSMLLGGIMTGLYSLLNRLDLPLESLSGDGLSVWSFALLCAIAGIATAKGGRWLGISQKAKTVTVHATLLGRRVTLTALVDSGNLLRDPVSGRSVIVADADALAPILPPSLLDACLSGNLAAALALPDLGRCKIIPVPTKTASGDSLLLALSPDALTLTVGKDTYPATHLLAPARQRIDAEGCNALIGRD